MKKLWQRYMAAVIGLPIGTALIAAAAFYNIWLAVCIAAFLSLLLVFYIFQINSGFRNIVRTFEEISQQLDIGDKSNLSRAPFPVCGFDEDGNIFWSNKAFTDDFFPSGKSHGDNICSVTGIHSVNELLATKRVFNVNSDRQYSAHCSDYSSFEGKKSYILYLHDDTELKMTEKKYEDSRLSIILIRVDNADEVYQNFKESEGGAIFGRIEEIISSWASKYSSLCKKLSATRFAIYVEEKNLRSMISDKFKLLEYIRNLSYADKKINVTLSAGIGKAAEIPEADESAKLALEMAQSRGGDQVAIKDGTEYSFYGGVSEGFDRSNKIKTRQIASSVSQLFASCENVMIMGHRFADLDAFGAALGVAAIAGSFKKTVNITVDKNSALAAPLIRKIEESDKSELLVSPDKAKYMVSENTVLVVVDTHRPDFSECPELLEKTNNIVIIDHHRKCVDCIENAVITFLSPTASSASEMVTEICQYIQTPISIDPLTAQGLLSGIALDTRNFVLRTGVRTFEAAAYLRSKGADTVEVKKLFSNDAEINKSRNQIVDDSFNYKGCAVSVVSGGGQNIRLITSQAADELLNLENTKASFVIFDINDTVCISARSFGEMNVQVVMEKFGGGGHATMAAAQIPRNTNENILEKLKEEIDFYYDNIS